MDENVSSPTASQSMDSVILASLQPYNPRHDVLDRPNDVEARSSADSVSASMIPQNNSFLCQLPVDVLHYLAKRLPASSAALLALTCKQLLTVIGKQYWEFRCNGTRYRHSETCQKNVFLASMDRHFPNHRRCIWCRTMHRRIRSHELQNACIERLNSRLCHHVDGHVVLCSDFILSWEQLHLATRGHRLGPAHGISLDVLTHSCTHTEDEYEYFRAVNIRPRISADGELLVETEHILLIGAYKTRRLLESDLNRLKRLKAPFVAHILEWTNRFTDHGLKPCQHIDDHPILLRSLADLLKCKLSHCAGPNRKDTCDVCGEEGKLHRNCCDCHTEWEVNMQESDEFEGGLKLVFKTWKNLGPGTHPREGKWQRHRPDTRWYAPVMPMTQAEHEEIQHHQSEPSPQWLYKESGK